MPRLIKIDDFFEGQRVRIMGDDPSWGKVERIVGNLVWIQYDDMMSETVYSCPIEEDDDKIYPMSVNQNRP